MFLKMKILTSCDCTPHVKGVGTVKAQKLVRLCRKLEHIGGYTCSRDSLLLTCLLLGLLTGAPSTLLKYISLVCGHHGVFATENLLDIEKRVRWGGGSEVTSDNPFEVGKRFRGDDAVASSCIPASRDLEYIPLRRGWWKASSCDMG